MDITYLGHSSFRIKTQKLSIVLDPYDPKTVGLKFPKVKGDLVTISHHHKDHDFVDGVKEYRKVIDGPGEYELSGVTIIGLSFWHDNKKGKERGRNTAYIFEADGIRLLHLGDLGHLLTEKDINAIGEINVLFVPVGGEYTIGPTEAVNIIKSIEPAITIPMHYQVKGLNQKVFSALRPIDDFLKAVELPVERMDKLSLKATELTEESKVVILNKRD